MMRVDSIRPIASVARELLADLERRGGPRPEFWRVFSSEFDRLTSRERDALYTAIGQRALARRLTSERAGHRPARRSSVQIVTPGLQ